MDEQGKALGITFSGSGIGLLLGPSLSGALYQFSNNKAAPFWFTLALVVIDGIGRLVIAEPEKRSTKSGHKPWTILKEEVIVWLAVEMVISNLGLTGLDAFIPLYLKQNFDLSPLFIGLSYGLLVLVFSVGGPVVGCVADKFMALRFTFVFLGGLIFGIAFALCAVVKQLWFFLVIMTLIGAFSAVSFTPILPIMNSIVEKKFSGAYLGAVAAVSAFSWSFGGSLGPIFFGFMIQEVGFVWTCIIFGITLGVFNILMAIRLATCKKIQLIKEPSDGDGGGEVVIEKQSSSTNLLSNEEKE